MQCPPDYIGVSAMIGAASLIGPRITIRPLQNSDWTEAANLYGMIVGRPGFMKSPAMKTALAPIHRLDKAARERHADAMLRFEAVQIVKKKNLKRAESTADGLIRDNAESGFESAVQNVIDALNTGGTEAPIQKRYIVDDANPASLMEIMRQNQNGVIQFSDELNAFFKRFEREDTSDLRNIYLKAWDGLSPHSISRIGRGLDLHVPSACLSVLGSIQPGVLAPYIRAALGEGEGADGMMQRLQLAVWPDGCEDFELVDRATDRTLATQAYEFFLRLDNLTPADCGAQSDQIDGKDISRPYLRFTLDAQEVFNEWYKALMRRTRKADADDLPAFIEHLSKYKKLVTSLALLLHLSENGKGPVNKAALEKALGWGKYLESHAWRIYTSGPNVVVNAAKFIIAKAKKGELTGEFVARDLYREYRTQLSNAELTQDALDLLEARGWVRSRTVPTGGKSKTAYSLRTE
jgi:putative DNA primase/helicase